MANFLRLAQEYLDTVWQLDPVRATQLGIPRYDHLLTDFSPSGLDRAHQSRSQLRGRLQEVDARELHSTQKIDLALMLAELDDSLAEAQLQAPRRAPYLYSETLGRALNGLMSREGEGLAERGRALLARLRQVREFLAVAQTQLDPKEVPPLWNRLGQMATAGLVRFLEDSVPRYAAGVEGGDQLVPAAVEALAVVKDYGSYLARTADQARGDFSVGEAFFNQRLRTMFMVELDAHQLYEFGREELARAERELTELAQSLDPNRSWQEVAEDIKNQHPTAEQLLASYAYEVQLAEAFVREHQLVSIPPGARCTVAPTAEYLQATTPLGYMATTAPFAPGLKSTLHITPIDPAASPSRQREHLRDNNYAFQRSIALHEAYPGHHLQLVHHKLFPSDVRKNFMTPLFVEGWGLYTEQMMREVGFLATPELRLMQLKNVLWRAVRVVVDTGLHTRGMSYQSALELMMEKVRMEGHMAQGEVSRYTTHYSATYTSSYLLGKALILQLREDYRAQRGADFTLKDFHDRLLSYGSIPVPLLRDAWLSPSQE